MVHPRKYSDKDTGGDAMSVSVNMVKGRLQLAMGHSDDRKTRDTEAIRWVLNKITEDREFEPFVASIGGSLASAWGRDVWEHIFNDNKENTKTITDNSNGWPYPTMSLVRAPNAMQQLKIRIEGLLKTCAESTFLDQPTRFARACVCIDAVASLRLNLEDKLEFNVDDTLMNQVLIYFGREKKRREKLGLKFGMPPSLLNNTLQLDSQMTSTLLEIKWKCMVVMAMKKILRDPDIVNAVREILDQLLIRRPPVDHQLQECQTFMTEDDIKLLLKDGQNLNSPEQQESIARNVDMEVLNAWEAAKGLRSLADIRRLGLVAQHPENRLDDFLSVWRESIKTMQTSLNALNTQLADGVEAKITNLVNLLMWKTGGVLEHLGASFEWPSDTKSSLLTRKGVMYYEIQGDILGLPTPEKTWEARAAFDMENKWVMPHLLPPRLLISDLLIFAHPTGHPLARCYMNSSFKLPKLPRLDSNSPDLAAKVLDIPEIDQLITQTMGARPKPQPFEDQLWRLRDLNDGGTGFLIELFFVAFGSLEQTALTHESKRLIEATLHAITRDEEKSKYLQKPACQKCLMALREELEEKILGWHLESAPRSPPSFVIDILLKLIDGAAEKMEEKVEPTGAEDTPGKHKNKEEKNSPPKPRLEPKQSAWKGNESRREGWINFGKAKAKLELDSSMPRALSTASGVVHIQEGPRSRQRRYRVWYTPSGFTP